MVFIILIINVLSGRKFTLVGDGLCVGFDSGGNVSQLYKSPGESKRGAISFVIGSTGKEQYIDLETEAARTRVME